MKQQRTYRLGSSDKMKKKKQKKNTGTNATKFYMLP